MSFKIPETNPFLLSLLAGGASGYAVELLINNASENLFPDNKKQSAIAEIGAVAVIDALMFMSAIALTNSGNEMTTEILVPLIAFTCSLSYATARQCMSEITIEVPQNKA